MLKLNAMNSREMKRVHAMLKEQFGFTGKLDYAFFINAKSRISVIARDILQLDLSKLRIDTLGLYFGTLYDDEIRLSIEGAQLIGHEARKNILDLDHAQFSEFVKGYDLEIEGEGREDGYWLIRHDSDFFGCAKLSGKRLLNFTPKERRLKVINE